MNLAISLSFRLVGMVVDVIENCRTWRRPVLFRLGLCRPLPNSSSSLLPPVTVGVIVPFPGPPLVVVAVGLLVLLPVFELESVPGMCKEEGSPMGGVSPGSFQTWKS